MLDKLRELHGTAIYEYDYFVAVRGLYQDALAHHRTGWGELWDCAFLAYLDMRLND